MERDELLNLCEQYVRQRRQASAPVVEIVDGYLHAEISENEKNSLLSFVLGNDYEFECDDGMVHLDDPVLAELEDPSDL